MSDTLQFSEFQAIRKRRSRDADESVSSLGGSELDSNTVEKEKNDETEATRAGVFAEMHEVQLFSCALIVATPVHALIEHPNLCVRCDDP